MGAVSPQARSRSAMCLLGNVFAVGRQHLFRIAAAGQTALVQPPDLVGQAPQQSLLVRDQEDRLAGAAHSVEGDGNLLPLQRVVTGQGLSEQHHRLGARPLYRARVGQFDTRGEAQQAPFSGAVLSDQTDDDAIGHGSVKIMQRFTGDTAKHEGHKR
jgi:hypothetical protein